MNALTAQNVIYVATTSDVEIEKAMNIRICGAGDRLTSLDLFFNMARLHADYVVTKDEFLKADRTNGTGYFNPLQSAIFVDANGIMVPVNSGIALWDPATDRRIFVVVLEPGLNIVVHDKISKNDRHQRATIIATSKVNVQGILGMNPVWEESNIHDLLHAARLFGFEFDRHSNSIIVPTRRVANWFKSYRDQLIPHAAEVVE
jgi:hypothetical protein